MSLAARRDARVFGVVVPLLLVLIAAAGCVSMVVGAADQSPAQVLRALGDGARAVFTGVPYPADGLHIIVLNLRLPRLLLAALVGVCLALSGAVMQALFQNPMADPYIVGVSSGAGLGAVLAMMLAVPLALLAQAFPPLACLGWASVPIFAFLGAFGVVVLVYVLSQRAGRVHTATLLLTGIAVGSLVAALTSFLLLLMDQDLRGVLFWLLGGLSARSWTHVAMVAPAAVIGLVACLIAVRPLNLLLLGEDTAASLGLDVARAKRWLLVLSSLLAAGAVAVGGIIAFVGLVVPHITRLLVGPDHRHLLPTAALSGALLMILSDIAARALLAPTELPLGIITSALGCPFFLYLLRRQGGRGL
jgi:iron complex transport system permease protein